MCIAGYVDIDQSLSLFDGNRAWNHLVRRLSFDKSPLSEAPPASANPSNDGLISPASRKASPSDLKNRSF